MAVVYSEHRIFPDAQARIADLELIISRARHLVAIVADQTRELGVSPNVAAETLTCMDRALDGTLYSFSRNGERR